MALRKESALAEAGSSNLGEVVAFGIAQIHSSLHTASAEIAFVASVKYRPA